MPAEAIPDSLRKSRFFMLMGLSPSNIGILPDFDEEVRNQWAEKKNGSPENSKENLKLPSRINTGYSTLPF
jgi:hypothetical protein